MPISTDTFPLVWIHHPQSRLAFEKLGLRWVPAPALSRFGFDIGGVQYTAAPFIGWFMDAEIGIRDLIDQSRYNVLPDVVRALGLLQFGQSLDDIPEFEKLAILSRAQAELNYAVCWSFQQAKVRMSDTLTASAMYCHFDDEHLREHGFRLPADPYWLSPPIGSLAPIWHRGGAPNYQPKPLIARHVEDPINSWKRKHGKPLSGVSAVPQESVKAEGRKPSIRLYYCSSSTTAAKLTRKAHKLLALRVAISGAYDLPAVRTLNDLDLAHAGCKDIMLIIASSSGRGQVPANGQALVRSLKAGMSGSFSFALFGNGASSYADSYNGAARTINAGLCDTGARQLLPLFESDSDQESPPWNQLEDWLQSVQALLFEAGTDPVVHIKRRGENLKPSAAKRAFIETLASDTFLATVVSCTRSSTGIKKVVLYVGDHEYEDLSYCDIFVPNKPDRVERLLHHLRPVADRVQLSGSLTLKEYVTDLVDLDRPLTDTSWALDLQPGDELVRTLGQASVTDAFRALPKTWHDNVDAEKLIYALPLRTRRRYSVASSLSHRRMHDRRHHLELLVKTYPGGVFSDDFLSRALDRCSQVRVRLVANDIKQQLQPESEDWPPVIALTTGSGIAPLQSHLQARLRASKPDSRACVTVFCGYKAEDGPTIERAIGAARNERVIDVARLLPSMPRLPSKEQRYLQDEVFDQAIRLHVIEKLKNPETRVFVCANVLTAKGFEEDLTAVLGMGVKAALGDRYIEELFDAAA